MHIKAKLTRPFIVLVICAAIFHCKGLSTDDLLKADYLFQGLGAIDLLSPLDGASTGANPSFSWTGRPGSRYRMEISTSRNFSTTVLSKTLHDTSYTLDNTDLQGLASLTSSTYYWRVSMLTGALQSKVSSFSAYIGGIIYVDANTTVTTSDGTATAPYKLIQTGLDNAFSKGLSNVFVAQGTYDEAITLRPGVALRGGYESSGWSRNTGTYTTTITSTGPAAVSATNITGSTASATILQGFTVRQSLSNGQAIYLQAADVIIEANTIISNAGSVIYPAQINTTGIHLFSSNAVIRGNMIRAYNANTATASGALALKLLGTSAPIVTNNIMITYSFIENYTGAIGQYGGSGIYSNNLLLTHHTLFDAYSANNLGTVTNNLFLMQKKFLGTNAAESVRQNTTADLPRNFENNVSFPLQSGMNATTYGKVGVPTTFAGINGQAMQSGLNAAGNYDLTPGTANVFVNAPTYWTVTRAAGATNTVITNYCSGTWNIFTVSEYFEINGDGIARQVVSCTTGTNTVTFTPAMSTATTNNMEIRYWGTNNSNFVLDYRLRSSAPAELKYGGKNTANNVCGNGSESCGGVTTDFLGSARTANGANGAANAGATGVSIGPYEFD
jgi:hypothetical protein